jgi:hypothetical protein
MASRWPAGEEKWRGRLGDATWRRDKGGPGGVGRDAANTGPGAADPSGRRWRCVVGADTREGRVRAVGHGEVAARLA